MFRQLKLSESLSKWFRDLFFAIHNGMLIDSNQSNQILTANQELDEPRDAVLTPFCFPFSFSVYWWCSGCCFMLVCESQNTKQAEDSPTVSDQLGFYKYL